MDELVAAYLKERYDISKRTQEISKITFDLTEREHLNLWEAKPLFLNKLALQLNRGKDSADSYMRSELGPCLSWVNKQARKDGVMNRDTAEVISHRESEKRFRIQAGDHHSEKSKRRISESKRGVKHTRAHKANVSAALTGVAKSPESNSKRSTAMKAHWDKKRAEKAAHATEAVPRAAEKRAASLNGYAASGRLQPHEQYGFAPR